MLHLLSSVAFCVAGIFDGGRQTVDADDAARGAFCAQQHI